MKIKKIFTSVIVSFLLLQGNFAIADEKFIDNNAINQLLRNNSNMKIVVSDYNTGKIVSEKDGNKQVAYKNLINHIAVFVLSEELRDEKINLETKIEVTSDEILDKYKIENTISVKDAIFILEQEDSPSLALTIFKKFNISISQAQLILDKLTLRDTELNKFEISDENKTSVKNLAYLTEVTLKNYPIITDITKNPEYEFLSGEKVENDVKFIPSDILRALGLNYDGKNATFIAYSGNTKFIVSIMDIAQEKDDFFDTIQELYNYLFANYNYKLALKAGTYDINNENITIEEDIYDFFYKDHEQTNKKYFLMNGKILLFQDYDYLSANNGTVFSSYKSNTDNSSLTKLKNTFIQDNKFKERNKREKLDIIVNRSQYFFAFVLLVYVAIFILIYLLQGTFSKKED
ncbi:hypothetical protein KMP11_02475 [Gemella sp. zg-570]|uniref:hypothetical protein n=1 Tax=Gemella sp. zg-570 TaxID=2840371 RepID=UPI001C0C2049|nr:hypothetical protein [Gemella sp. zg-570]QWQ39214.1 hypothetical protein KMP11_02475 [Gemella sp. zg-570]